MDDFDLEVGRSVSVGNNLEYTKQLVATKLNCELNEYDQLIIEEKYVDALVNLWLSEAPEQVVQCIDSNNILKFIEKLNIVNTFVDSYNLLCEFSLNPKSKVSSALYKYSFLLKELCGTSSKINYEERCSISNFKIYCHLLLKNKCEFIKNEKNFFEHLQNLLKSSKCPDELCHSLGLLPSNNGFKNINNFKMVLQNIIESELPEEDIFKVQQSAKKIIEQSDFIFINDVIDLIESHFEPTVVTKTSADGRVLLEVSGKHMVVSKLINEIERMLQECNDVEEVRFVNANVIHIDTNLSAAIWHGKNIVVYSNTAIVSSDQNIEWDVSGEDAAILPNEPEAGTGEDGCGLPGVDGQNGESGGNVLMMVDDFINSHNFTVKSNGGNGSKGQDGGIGKDGDEGYYLEEKAFKTVFPPASKWVNSNKRTNLKITKNNVLKNFEVLNEFYVGYTDVSPMSKSDFQHFLSKEINDLNSFYFKVKTNDGCKITFSFYCGGLFTVCQSFLLHEGSFGTEGKPGGLCGKGGIKGYAGDIIIHVNDCLHSDVAKLRDDGKEGQPGKQGSSGKRGKAGLDRAYEDYSLSLSNAWPKWFIPDVNENMKLKVSYHNENSSERVFCNHNNLYAQIVPREDEIVTINRYNNVLNQNEFHEHLTTHNQRKKTISEKSIKEQYQKKMSSIDLLNRSNIIEAAESALKNNSVDERLEPEQQIIEKKVIRLATYFEKNLFNSQSLASDNILYNNGINVQSNDSDGSSVNELIELILRDPNEIHNWTNLLLVRLDMTQLQVLWQTASTCLFSRSPTAEKYNEQFKIGFCNKFQLAVLEHLANKIKRSDYYYTGNIDPVDNKSQNGFEEFFTISEYDKTPKSDLNQCLLRDTREDRQSILSAFWDLFGNYDSNKVILNKILMIFLSEFSSFSPDLLMTLQKVNELRESNTSSISVTLDAFISALRRENYGSGNLYNELNSGIVEKNTESLVAFEKKVQKDELLSALYNSYVEKTMQKYVWKCIFKHSISEREKLSQCMADLFLDKGSLSVCYRELLAYHFKTNILIYSRNLSNQISLSHNHNPRAETSVHFLKEGNKFLHLNVNHDLVEMYRCQKSESRLVNDILIHIDSFTEKEQFDTFVLKCSGSFRDVKTSKALKIRNTLLNILMEESNIKKILNAYHLDSQKNTELSWRLDKLKHEFTECETILHILALHFENEGTHISTKELIYIVNVVLKCALNVPHVIPLVSWILATHCQNQWLVEIILLKLELNFKKTLDVKLKASWREYLKKQSGEIILMLIMEKICEENFNATEKQFGETISLFSNISQAHVGLDQLNFTEWKYYLKNKFWAHQLIEVTEWPNDVLNSASYYLVVLENLVGSDSCKKLIKVLKKRKSELDRESTKSIVPNIFNTMTNKDVCLNNSLLEILINNNIIDWVKVIEKECFSEGKERSLAKLIELIKKSDNTSKEVKNNLDNIAKSVELSSDIIKTMKQHIENESELKELISKSMNYGNQTEKLVSKLKNYLTSINITDNIIHSVSKPTKDLNSFDPNHMFEILFATVVSAVEIKHNIIIRDTQKLAIMTMLKSKNSILSQVSTGEGKTFIIVIFTIVKVLMEGQKVDIITSSRVLAERDSELNKDIYNLFGINVGHNCSEDIEERKQAYSNNSVVYGELANFQRDYLLDRVYSKNILSDRKFDTIVVDEVDSMLLDKGNNTLYLSHEIPGLDKLEPVFIYIWKFLHIPVESNQLKLEVIVSVLKSKVLHDIFGIISRESLKHLDTTIDDRVVNNTWNFLESQGIIDNTGKVLKQQIEDYLEILPEKCIDKNHLKYIFQKISERETSLTIPNYLKNFVEEHLEEWIKNGVRAMIMEDKVDYVLDTDRSGSSCDRSPNIMLVDQDTGTDLINSQWENGLHQFLQLKHGCRLSLISLKAVFISNVTYLKKYKHQNGLTGTLGSEVERKLLKDTYEVDFVTIPTAKTKLFTEELSIVCLSKVDWSNKICKEVYTKIQDRSVLIICETVNDVMYLKEEMCNYLISKNKRDKVKNIHTYTRDYEELTIAYGLEPGHIIISTNLAGRGTDIILSKKLIESGGLHVCLSYLPRNRRIEEQAFGRAARNGQPGSGQMIFQNCMQHTALTVIHLKQQRDINEVLKIGEIKDYHKSHIEPEESCFEEFLNVYSSIRKNEHHPECIKSLLLQISLDQWAFWMDSNSNFLDNNSVKTFISKIIALKEENFEDWSQIIESPFQLVKLGLALVGEKQYEKAIALFNRVIEEEPLFSEGAQYYRLCAKSKQNLSKNEILKDLNSVAKQLTERINSSSLAAYMVDCLKKRNPSSVLQIESFKEQQLNVAKINGAILQSIRQIVGYEISFEEFILPTYMDEETAFTVFNDLVDRGMIKKPKVKDSISEEDFKFAVKYGILPKELSSVLEKYKSESFTEKELLKKLEETCPLPSRELFWSKLISKRILINEKTYCIINMEKLKYVDPSLIKMIEQLKNTFMENNNEVWLYQPYEIGYSESDHVIIKQEILLENIGELKYTHLLNRYVVNLNKVANLLKTGDNVKFDQFDSLEIKDFSKIGIISSVALNIICDLEEQCIIKKNERSQDYMLLADSNDLINVELSKYKAYSSDVVQLLNVCFSFRLALRKLQLCKTKQMNTNEEPYLTLPIRPHLNIINDLYEHKVVSKYSVNPEEDISKKLMELYPKAMEKQNYEHIFKDLYDETTTRTIIEHLISSECLIELNIVKRIVTQEKLNLYSINMCKMEKLSLPPELMYHKETIKLILQRQFLLGKEKSKKGSLKGHIEHIINCHTSMLHKVETPSFSLKLLSNELQHHEAPSSEFGIFSLNGFENILVLEEKKYTLKMLVCVSGLALFGIAEIAVGVVLSTILMIYPAIGAAFISEGICDIIYSISSLYSGHFSISDYAKTKAISLTISAICFLKPIEIFRSVFGQSLSSRSSSFLSSVKDKCFTVLENRTTFMSNWLKHDLAEGIRILTVHVAKKTSAGCGIGLTFEAVDNFLEPQLERLGEELVKLILGDIDEIDSHNAIGYIREIHLFSGEYFATKIVSKSCSKVLEEYKVKNKNDWKYLLHKLMTVVDKESINCLRQIRNKNSSWMDSDNVMLMVIGIITKLNDIISTSNHILPKTIIPEIMGSLEVTFKMKLDELRRIKATIRKKTTRIKSITDSEKETFIREMLDDFKNQIKSVVTENIQSGIVNPLLSKLKTIDKLIKMESEKSSFYKQEDLKEFIEGNEQMYKNKEFMLADKLEQPNRQSWYCMDYDECLLELFKRKRCVPLFLEILNNSSSVSDFFIELCCSVIPLALRQEGLNVPMLRLEVDKNGMQYIYGGNNEGGTDVLTIKISSDEAFLTNLSQNKILIRNVLDTIYSKILKLFPVCEGLTANLLNKMIISAVENDFFIQNYITASVTGIDNVSDDKTNMYNLTPEDKIQNNTTEEENSKMSYEDVKSPFVSTANIQVQVVKTQVIEVFKTALDKINYHLQLTQPHLKSFKLSLEDFIEMKHVIISNNVAGKYFDSYATRYELVIPLIEPISELVSDYNVTMSLNGHCNKNLHNFLGPRIDYGVVPVKIGPSVHLDNCMKGHIPLGFDYQCAECAENMYTIKHCHSAGELVLPTLHSNNVCKKVNEKNKIKKKNKVKEKKKVKKKNK